MTDLNSGDLDAQTRGLVWSGTIPVSITLAPNEVTTLETPPSLILSTNRCSYLPLLNPHVKKHFCDSAPPHSAHDSSGVWFDCNGVPLKWYIPIGLLFDLMSAKLPTGSPPLPWNIVVHFLDYPIDTLVPCPDEETARWHYMNNEADCLMHGNANKVMDMARSEQILLWDSIKSMDREGNWSVKSKFCGAVSHFTHIPIRIYEAKDPQTWSQLPLEYSESTLGDALISIMPQLAIDGLIVTIHGILVPLDTPISWIWVNMSYPDSFVHLIVNHTIQ